MFVDLFIVSGKGVLSPVSKAKKMESDFVVIENATWCPGMNSVMEGFRHDGKFCNVTLRSCDDQEFHAHDLVLAASSADMQTLLLTQMQKDCVLQIETVRGKTIEYMLQFIYSGHVCLPVGELSALAAVSEQLGIEQLKNLCSNIKRELQSQEVQDLPNDDGTMEDTVPYSYSEADANDMSAAFCGDIRMGPRRDAVVIEQAVEEADLLAEDQDVVVTAETVEISQGNLLLTTVKMDRQTSQQQQQQVSFGGATTTLEPTTDRAMAQADDRMLTHTAGGEMVHHGNEDMTQTDDMVLTQTHDNELPQTSDRAVTHIGDRDMTQTCDNELAQTGDGERAQAGVQVKVECLQHEQANLGK